MALETSGRIESTARLSKQCREYAADLTMDEPQHVASALLQARANGEISLELSLIDQLLTVVDFNLMSDEQWMAFSSTKLPAMLVDIACDVDIYQPEDPSTDEPQKGLPYAAKILIILRTWVYHLTSGIEKGDTTDMDCAESVLNKYPKLCSTLWRKRALLEKTIPVVTFSGFDEDCFAVIVVVLIALFTRLHETYRRESPRLMIKGSHILLYYWTYSKDIEHAPMALSTLERIIIANGNRDSPDDLEHFFEEAVGSCTSSHHFRIVKKFCRLLKSDKTSDEELNTLLCVLSVLIRNCAATRRVKLSEGESVLRSLIFICQRQFCLGRQPEYIDFGIEVGFGLISFLLDDKDALDQVRKEIDKKSEDLKLIPLMAKILVRGVAAKLETDVDNVVHVLGYHAMIVVESRRHLPSKQRYRLDLLNTNRKDWLPTLKALQELPTPDHDTIRLRDHALKYWRKFGEALGLNEGTARKIKEIPHNRTNPPRPDGHWPISKGCFWKECLCSGSRPEHHLRVCKGCWSVLYCSSKCQRRDWEDGGHRKICGQL